MNSKITSLAATGIALVLAVVGVILVVLAMGYTEVKDPVSEEIISDTGSVSAVVTFSMALFWISIGAIALFTVIAIATNPKRFIPTAIGIAVFAILVLIGYGLSDVETTGKIVDLEGATEGNLRLGGVGIKTTYVLVIVAVGLIIAQGARSLLGYFSK